MATKPTRGEGGLKALVAGPLGKEIFFAASLGDICKEFLGVPVGILGIQ